MWRYEFHIKGIEIDEENTKLLVDKLMQSLTNIGREPTFNKKIRDGMLIFNANIKDIEPIQAIQETENIISAHQEHLTDSSGLLRIFQLITPITTFRREITTGETIPELPTETISPPEIISVSQPTHPIWAEVIDASLSPSRPQPQLNMRYNTIFSTPTKSYRVVVDIPTEFFAQVKNRKRKDFNELVKISQSDITPLSTAFKQLQKTENYSNEQLANVILNFAQSIPYIKDKVSVGMEDYHNYAIETLASGIGDCEDKSILMAAITKNLGYDTILINPFGHIAVGITGNFKGYGIDYAEKHYYYAETTTPGWQIGELRADLTNVEMNVIPI